MTDATKRPSTKQREKLKAPVFAKAKKDAFGNSLCALNCGAIITLDTMEMDHVTSLANGGTNDPSNFQPVCKPCNLAKGAGATQHGTNDGNREYRRQLRKEGRTIAKMIENKFRKHLYFPPEQDYMFIVLTMAVLAAQEPFMTVLETQPIMAANSAGAGSGKSVVTDMAGALIPGAERHSSLASFSSLARSDAHAHVLDEAQSYGLHKADFRRGLNGAFKYNGTYTANVEVMTKEGKRWKSETIPTFSSIWLSGLRMHLADDTRSRCIWIDMTKALGRNKPAPLYRKDVEEVLPPIGEQALAWAQKAFPFIKPVHMPDHLEGRRKDVWMPLAQVAALIGLTEYTRIINALEAYEARAEQTRTHSDIEDMVTDLLDAFTGDNTPGADGFASTNIILQRLTDSYPDRWGGPSGRALTVERMSAILKPLNLPKTQCSIQGVRMRGYDTDALTQALKKWQAENQPTNQDEDESPRPSLDLIAATEWVCQVS